MKYKVGDRVVILVPDPLYYSKGDKATISRIDETGDYWAIFEDTDSCGPLEWCIGKEPCFELASNSIFDRARTLSKRQVNMLVLILLLLSLAVGLCTKPLNPMKEACADEYYQTPQINPWVNNYVLQSLTNQQMLLNQMQNNQNNLLIQMIQGNNSMYNQRQPIDYLEQFKFIYPVR